MQGRRPLQEDGRETTTLVCLTTTAVLLVRHAANAPLTPKATATSIAPPGATSGRLVEETSRAQAIRLRIKTNATAPVRPKRAVRLRRSNRA